MQRGLGYGGLRVHTPRQSASPGRPGSEANEVREVQNVNQFSLGYLSAGLGVGLALLGAGFGIGRLGAAAMEGTARQPSAGGDIRTSMIIAAALIEGVTLFAEVVCIILATKA
jgi:F-type H+-transporting ATPase subunit c